MTSLQYTNLSAGERFRLNRSGIHSVEKLSTVWKKVIANKRKVYQVRGVSAVSVKSALRPYSKN
jgi:hypothetical protein